VHDVNVQFFDVQDEPSDRFPNNAPPPSASEVTVQFANVECSTITVPDDELEKTVFRHEPCVALSTIEVNVDEVRTICVGSVLVISEPDCRVMSENELFLTSSEDKSTTINPDEPCVVNDETVTLDKVRDVLAPVTLTSGYAMGREAEMSNVNVLNASSCVEFVYENRAVTPTIVGGRVNAKYCTKLAPVHKKIAAPVSERDD
jgi:hypothetical protein